MTHIQLKRAYYISREIRLYQDKLRDLRMMSLTGGKLDGMPKAQSGDKVSSLAAKAVDLERKIQDLREQLLDAETEIMEYISGIDDSLIRQIIYCRCVCCMSWSRVAHKVGGGNTADTCRKAYSRWMKKEENDGSD